MTKRIKSFLISSMICLLAVSAIFLTLNVNTASASQRTLTGTKTQAEVTAEVELTTLVVADGASIRTQSPKGIRFTTSISKDEVAQLPDNAVFGTLMMPTELVDGELTLTTDKVANAKAVVYSEKGNNYEYSTALVGSKNDDNDFNDFSSSFYTKEITARSYVTYTYGEGTTVTTNAVKVYGPFSMPVESYSIVTVMKEYTLAGRVADGVLRKGEKVSVIRNGKVIAIGVAKDLLMFEKSMDETCKGDNVGIVFEVQEGATPSTGDTVVKYQQIHVVDTSDIIN